MMRQTPKGRNDTHKLDYSKILDGLLVGSDFCKKHKCKEHKVEFEKLNVEVEINLTSEKKERPPDNVISYIWLPVVDGRPPSMQQFDLGTAIIHEALENGVVVYVHCKNGHGRSPTLVSAYLVRYEKMGVAEAMDFVSKKRPEIHIEYSQKEALIKYQKRLKND